MMNAPEVPPSPSISMSCLWVSLSWTLPAMESHTVCLLCQGLSLSTVPEDPLGSSGCQSHAPCN